MKKPKKPKPKKRKVKKLTFEQLRAKQKISDYLWIMSRQWNEYDHGEFQKLLMRFHERYPETDGSQHHRSEKEILAAAKIRKQGQPKNPEASSLYTHVYSDKNKHKIFRNWHPDYPIPDGYQTLDSKIFTHIETGDHIKITTEQPQRSLYREYLMTHHSLRAEQYPNGPPRDDRSPIITNYDQPKEPKGS